METHLIITDSSPSAASHWAETVAAAASAIAILPAGSITCVALLGTEITIPAQDWRPDIQIPAGAVNAGSFLAPVLQASIGRDKHPDLILLFGSGTVFDLEDWIILYPNSRWLLVQTGNQPLQEAPGILPEFLPNQLQESLAGLAVSNRFASQTIHNRLNGFVKHTWDLDKTGYPLIRIDLLDAYLQLFPTVKTQFEAYLAARRPAGYDDAWYRDYLEQDTPRLSPCASRLSAIENLFALALLPAEAEAYAAWQGTDCRPVTVEEWRQAWSWLELQDVSIPPADIERRMAPTARRLWESLLHQVKPDNLLDLSLMRGGILEWVCEPGGGWYGMGKPRRSHPFHNPLRDIPLQPTSLEQRSVEFGFRLIRRV